MTKPGSSALREAFLALQTAQERVAALEAEKNEPIAIIGIGCRIPGMRDETPQGFWELLAEGRDVTGAGLPARWREVHADAEGVPEYAGHASLLSQVDQFDAEFFGISPREAAGMDPQQRLLLEVSWQALEHAGISPTSLYASPTGVYVGICTSDYSLLRLSTLPLSTIDGHFGSGTAHSIASGRISYVLGLQGPSLSLDTACSSSLVAVHLAVESLRRGECSLALAGGVNVLLTTEPARTFSQAGMLSPTGRCSAFAAQADGFVQGEGCGVVVLKRLSEAQSAGDRILALIRSTAVNHDGPSSGLTVPNGLAQQSLLRRALGLAGVTGAQVSYVEAHGTGTSLGDPIEAEAMGAVLGVDRAQPLLIGSVKTNIGHLESAAGVAGLIKVVLSLGRGELPAQLHFTEPSPHIRWEQLQLKVVDELQAWQPIEGRRIAGLSSFGFSGTNAHVLLEGAPEVEGAGLGSERGVEVLALSARTSAGLKALAQSYRERLGGVLGAEEWRDVCHTAAVGRSAFTQRVSVRGADAAALAAGLSAFLADEGHAALVKGEVRSGSKPRVGFLFTGQGSQYAGMGAALYAQSQVFRAVLERAEGVLADRLPYSLGAVMRGEHPESAALLNQTLYTQPALYVFEYALAQLWRSFGVEPVAALGHSLGEYVGCALAGVFGFEEGLGLVAERARLMHSLSSQGAMLVVSASESEIAPLLLGREQEVSLAGVNAAKQVTLSGARAVVEALAEECKGRGWRTHALPVSQAFHSPLMEPIREAFQERARAVSYAVPRFAVISNLSGAPLEQASAEYWWSHMREAVRFKQGLSALRTLGCDVLLEVGPRPVLIQLARQAAASEGGPACRYVSSLKGPGNEEWEGLAQGMQELYAAGAELDWAGWNRDYARRRVDAPTYPFERRRHWLSASVERVGAAQAMAPGPHPLLGRRLRSALAGGQFDADLSATGASAWLADHRIGGQAILPATGFMEMMLAAGEVLNGSWRSLKDLSILAPLTLPASGTRAVQTIVDEMDERGARVRVYGAEGKGSGAPSTSSRQLRFELLAEAHLADLAASTGCSASRAAIQARCSEEEEGAAHYREMASRGAQFGAAFLGVQRLWSAPGAEAPGVEALAEVRVELAPLVQQRPHPALLDACLQSARVLLRGADTYLPVRLERFDCRATSWPQHLYVHVRLIRAEPDPVLDFTLLDHEDQILAELKGLQFQNISRLQNANSWFYELVWAAAPTSAPTAVDSGHWLVVGSGSLAAAIAAELKQSGASVAAFATVTDALAQTLKERSDVRAMVYAPPESEGVDADPMAGGDAVSELLSLSRLHARQGFPTNCRLYTVTRAVHAVRANEATLPVDAALSGLAATLFNEFPELKSTRIDIDPADHAKAARNVAQEVLADTSDDWAAWRDGRRYVARLRQAPEIDAEPTGPVHLVSDRGLDGLEWRTAAIRALESHELEIEVRAAPLNFHDVVSVVGLISTGAALGGECSGVVTRIGSSVTRFRPGDAVVAITSGSFATFAVAHEEHAVAKPVGLAFESACAQGLVYLTADRCLNGVARMKRGERVLIHAAAGGVGNAAIQLCLRAGVEIYATVGSEAKRSHLKNLGVKHIFSSRTVDFAQEIGQLTDGSGVDIVLNSLSGAFVDAGLSLLKPGGRFVEIGKTDIRRSDEVAKAHPGVSYTAVDLVDNLRAAPRATLARLGELLEDMGSGTLLPVPVRTYDFSDVKSAFRELASGRNIGKLVLTPRATGPLVRKDGSYIVTGGSSGVGFATAEWLAAQGAARVLLLSRRPPAPDIEARIASWREKGVDMLAVQGDAGARDSIDRIVAEAGEALRGVIHCANTLDDAPVGELTWERFQTVLRPKALGAWHLHLSTAGLPLDFFVLFSSFAGLTGSRGAANYAAANVALDSLAHLRKHQGLTALSLNWGTWADIGWAARQPGGAAALPGFNSMKPELGLRAMARAMRNSRSAQLAIAPIDWRRLASTVGRNAASLLSEFVAPAARAAAEQAGASLADFIASNTPAEARAALIARIRVIAAGALGIDEPEQIDPHQPLQDLGLDSILAVDVRSTLAHALRRSLPATLLFDFPTINSLADYCLGAASPELAQSAVAAADADDVDLLELIEGMSDDEVDARLSTRGAQVAV